MANIFGRKDTNTVEQIKRIYNDNELSTLLDERVKKYKIAINGVQKFESKVDSLEIELENTNKMLRDAVMGNATNEQKERLRSKRDETQEQLKRAEDTLRGFESQEDKQRDKIEDFLRDVGVDIEEPPQNTQLVVLKNSPKSEGGKLYDINRILKYTSEFVRPILQGLAFDLDEFDLPSGTELVPLATIVQHFHHTIKNLDDPDVAKVELQDCWNKMILEKDFQDLYMWLRGYELLEDNELKDLLVHYEVEYGEGSMGIEYKPNGYDRHIKN